MCQLNIFLFSALFLASFCVCSPVPEDRVTFEGNKMVAYVSNWAQYRQSPYSFSMDSDIDPFAMSHLVFAFATVTNGLPNHYEWNDQSEPWAKGNYEKMNDLKYINPNLRVLLAFGGWNAGSEEFSAMVSSESSRSTFINALIPFLRYPICKDGEGTCYGFDGIDLDWEYPGARGGVPSDKENYVLLIQEMRTAFEEEALMTGYEPLLITAAVPAGKTNIDVGYDIIPFCDGLDFVNLMSYDLGGAWANETQHNAPLYNGIISEDGGELSVSWAANYWQSNGCPAEKLVIGLPLYGRSFELESELFGDLRAPVVGPGPAGVYTQESGFLAYFEVQDLIDNGDCYRIWLEDQKVPYCIYDNVWIGYDDIESLSYKLQFILDEEYGGAMVWALPLDDFINGYPLFSYISNTILEGTEISSSPSVASTPALSPSSSPTPFPSPSKAQSLSSNGNCVEEWAQCGGLDYSGSTQCCEGLICIYQSEWWSSCSQDNSASSASSTPSSIIPPSPSISPSQIINSPSPSISAIISQSASPSESDNESCIPEWEQCGGDGFSGSSNCCPELECIYQSQWWSSCQVTSGTSLSSSPSSIPSASPTPSAPAQTVMASPSIAPTSGSLSELISESQFNELFPQSGVGPCSGGAIFSYENFLLAAEYYPEFANVGDIDTRKRELAAFLGQTSQETSGWWSGQEYEWGYCFNSEVGCTNEVCSYCSPSSEFPCVPEKGYFGRGAIQISYNYNYGLCSQDIFGDKNILLNNPDSVLEDGVLAFRTAFWFWMREQSPKPSCHDVISGIWLPSESDIEIGRYPGYGMLTNIINGGLECNQPTPQKVFNRVAYYERYCSILGVSPGENLYCDNMQSY